MTTTEKKTRSKIGKSSRERGKAFELELVHFFNDRGYNTRRGQQYSGHNGDADVVGLPGIHIEAKFREKLNIREALAQAVKDVKRDATGQMEALPTVFWKKARQGTVAIMRLGDWTELLGYMHDFIRLATWHNTEYEGQPPEPEEDMRHIGEIAPEYVRGWIRENFTPYLAWAEGYKRPWCYFYAGDERWVTEEGGLLKEKVLLWKELPYAKDQQKLTQRKGYDHPRWPEWPEDGWD